MSTNNLTAPPIPDEADLDELRTLVRSIVEKSASETLHVPRIAIPYDASLWQTLAEAGLTLVSTPESAGGSGAGLAEAVTVLSVAGEYAVPLPLAETDLLAAWLLVCGGLDVPMGPLSSARGEITMSASGPANVAVSGTLQRVPWARDADAVVVLGSSAEGEVVFLVPTEIAEVFPGHNLAHEPRDCVTVRPGDAAGRGCSVVGAVSSEWGVRGALARAAQTCGALESALGLTLEHASTRIQFGRPLGRFQAVQHLVAEAAGEVTMARAACDVAVRTGPSEGSQVRVRSWPSPLRSRRLRAPPASSAGSHTRFTVRSGSPWTTGCVISRCAMQAWRSEFGGERIWERRIGEIALAEEAPDVWSLVTQVDPTRCRQCAAVSLGRLPRP